jgi:hypothetical protein
MNKARAFPGYITGSVENINFPKNNSAVMV